MATLSLGNIIACTSSSFQVSNGAEDYRTTDGSNDVDCGAMVFNKAPMLEKSSACILTSLNISYQYKYAKATSAAYNPYPRFTFYPYALTGVSISNNIASYSSRGKLSENTQNTGEIKNTSYQSGSKSMATDAGTYQFGVVTRDNNYPAVFAVVKRMNGTLNARAYLKSVTASVTYTPRCYVKFFSNDGNTEYSSAIYNEGSTPAAPNISVPSGYELKGWSKTKNSSTTALITKTGDVDVNYYAVLKSVPPSFSSVALTYSGAQISQSNKVPVRSKFIISAGIK